MKKPDVASLYEKYRASRQADTEVGIQRILTAARKGESGIPPDSREPESAGEQVTSLFRTWQEQRDAEREARIRAIVTVARERRQGPSLRSRPLWIASLLKRVRSWLDVAEGQSTGWFAGQGWQVAVPTLLLIAAVTLVLPRLEWWDGKPPGYASDGIPASLLARAPRAVPLIQPSLPSTSFAFAGTNDPGGTAFRLGVVTTDLYLFAAADRSRDLEPIFGQIERELALLGLAPLGDEELREPGVIARTLDRRFSGHPQETMFRFGKWLEGTLLATAMMLEESTLENRRLLEDLLGRWREEDGNQVAQSSPAVSRLIRRLEEATPPADASSEQLRRYRRLLAQVKATLM